MSDVRHSRAFFNVVVTALGGLLLLCCSTANSQLIDKFGQSIPETQGLVLEPNAILTGLDLTNLYVPLRDPSFGPVSIEGVSFENSNLRGAEIGVPLSGVSFRNAIVDHALIKEISPDQLYSTASYQSGNLSGMSFVVSEIDNGRRDWDLGGTNLSNSTLAANFAGADFRDADLRGANLSRRFVQSEQITLGFDDADFTGANIEDAVFLPGAISEEQFYSTGSYQSQNLRGVNFAYSVFFLAPIPYELTGWNFQAQDLTGSSFEYAEAAGVDFSDANLTQARMQRSELTGSRFDGAWMEQVDLFFSNLTRTSFQGAGLVGGDLRGTTAVESDLRGANLGNASLQLSKLDSADFDQDTLYNQWTAFPGEFDPVANGLTRVNAPIGDLDADGVVNASDIDALTQRIQRGDDVNHFALESYRNGWIIRDLRRDDFVYLSGGLSTHDALADLGVNAIQQFDGGSELARNRQLATLRKPTEQNAPWLEPMFDLNADGSVDIDDREMLISDVLGVRSGDTNFDGFVNSEDLGILLNSFGTSDGRGWEFGNFNTDTTIDSADLGLLLNNFDPSGSIASVVPEPHYGYILVGSWLFGIGLQTRRRIW